MTHRLPLAPALVLSLALLLPACGGGGDGDDPVGQPLGCSVPERNGWLREYMRQWYLWSDASPSPDPAPYTSVEAYFADLLYGGDAEVPADRFSVSESTESFERFFGAGRSLGYGLFVAGVEVEGRPEQPLRIRYVEPRSDAALQGLRRGEQIVSIDGRPASELIAAGDFDMLVPQAAGDRLALVVRGSGGDRAVTLTAGVFDLTPLGAQAVVATPGGRKVGYLMVKDMIGQVEAPLAAAVERFRAEGVAEAVIDLRYNGGGQVSVGRTIASHVNPGRTAGRDYVRLLYNAQRSAANDRTFRFGDPAAALALTRVYVLTGPRTCSASEQLINGLKPFVEVVVVGDTTCGKPVGFLPRSDGCGTTFSAVNFESENAQGVGRYYDGLAPSCEADDDLDRSLGDPGEGLLAAALAHADSGACPATARRAEPLGAPREPGRRRWVEPGEVRGMTAR
jgi:carboxyl-terminal processing protease